MDNCLHSPRNRKDRRLGLVGLLSEGILVMIIAAWGFREDASAVFLCMLLFLTGLLLAGSGIFLYFIQDRKYSVDSLGITILYFRHYKVRYLWPDIESISVCDINHAAKDRDNFDVVIRIVARQEKAGPFSRYQPLTLAGYERWRTFGYSLVHLKTIIILEYTEERLAEIKALSGKEILNFLRPYAKDRGWYEDEQGNRRPLVIPSKTD